MPEDYYKFPNHRQQVDLTPQNEIPEMLGFGSGVGKHDRSALYELRERSRKNQNYPKLAIEALRTCSQYPAAFSHFSNALKIYPDSAEANMGLAASIFFQAKNPDKISNKAVEALQIAEQNLTANANKIIINLFNRQNIPEGLEFMEWLFKQKMYKCCVAVCNNLLDLIPNTEENKKLLRNINLKMGVSNSVLKREYGAAADFG